MPSPIGAIGARPINSVGGQGSGSCCSPASDCCKKGLACCKGGSQVDKGGLLDVLKQLAEQAKLDPAGVVQALKQNPEFAQILSQGMGGTPRI